MRAIHRRLQRSSVFLVLAILSFSASPASGREPGTTKRDQGGAVTVRPGDSWGIIRTRLYPIDALKAANPELARRGLHPGDVVLPPFLPASEFSQANEGRRKADRRLEEAEQRQAEMKSRLADFDAVRRELDREQASRESLRRTSFLLLTLTLALSALLVAALESARRARRQMRNAERRLSETTARYGSLRSSLLDIERDLQRRMVSLLHLHRVRVVTESDVKTSTTPVIALARDLKKKHAS